MSFAFRFCLPHRLGSLTSGLFIGTATTSFAAGEAVSASEAKASADLAWMMAAAGMVMMMQVGFLLLEAGMVRSKNSINVAQKNLLDFVFGVVGFAAVGFMLAFGSSGWLPIGLDADLFFLRDLDTWLAGFFVFQVMFCGTAATIVSGAVAERMKLSAYVFGSIVLSTLIYPIFAHWVWGGAIGPNSGAFLGNLGFVDFAGSTVVHATGGWVALAACLVIGPRLGRFDAAGRPIRMAGHNPVLATTGGLILFFGWIGFNGGSTLTASADVAPIILNTVLAGGMGTCVGYALGIKQDGIVLPEKALSGMLGGLVAVTAGCHLLETGGALLTGALGAGVAVIGTQYLEEKLKVDDAVGAIGVHAFAGVAGTIALALLAPVDRLPAGGRFDQLYIQVFGSALNFYWAFGLGFAFFWCLDRLAPIRVSADVEDLGLNVAEHGTRLGVGHVEHALSKLVSGNADLGDRLPVDPGDEAEKLTRLFNSLMDNIQQEERGRHELEAQVRDQEESERVAALANATFEAIVMHEGGVIIDGNEQFEVLTGRGLSELIGTSILDLVDGTGRRMLIDEPNPAPDVSREFQVVREDGTLVPIEARGRNIEYRGRHIRISCLVDLSERKAAEGRMRHLAQHDPLTGLANRALFTETLAAHVGRANRDWGCGVLLVDLDHFKDVNDLYGHPAGDEVIRETARRLTAVLGPSDMAARLGGDEFAVILGNCHFEAQIEDLSRRLIEAFRQPFDTGQGERIKCGISIGGALCPEHAQDFDELIGRADVALYHAKKSGRSTFRAYRRGMDELIEKRRALEADIERGLERDEFELYLQPRVAARDGAIVGYEALLRWSHPERGMVQPGDFIPVAEVSGKIIDLGEWVLREACRLAADFPDHLHLSINVSPVQFRHPDFLKNVEDILSASGVLPRKLELEITESVLIDDDQRALVLLGHLKSLGLRIALDDFGTGYSSLSYLRRYPFDVIKIDRSFVSALGEEETANAIIRTIIDLGSGLGMRVVAEGVETVEQARYLTEAGCDELQGYLLGRPQPVDAAITAINASLVSELRSIAGRSFRQGGQLALVGTPIADVPIAQGA
ncbi:Amt family ammonium transporter [Peteryoungia aggregata LMG 23059]|uniref:Amt family ammonium transporter n=1 Tax=Peteryoungia aggregata LMG 23059 TaxID=1368425 RepID=A0ABU0G8H8_9HYPH|nr:ammonium transporter [Peteryoungia aggregata]MDQ0420982.1 Amt family ammonium transporter [Peteryoungia aggregata LMG 23059]